VPAGVDAMILNFPKASVTQMQGDDFDTDTSYLQEPDAFEVNQEVQEWPVVRNPFLDRMALRLKAGFSGTLSIEDFMGLVAGATAQQPNTVFEFSVTIGPNTENSLTVSFVVREVSKTGYAPLSADNAGFFVYAMNWMAKNRPTFNLGVVGDQFFWVHLD